MGGLFLPLIFFLIIVAVVTFAVMLCVVTSFTSHGGQEASSGRHEAKRLHTTKSESAAKKIEKKGDSK